MVLAAVLCYPPLALAQTPSPHVLYVEAVDGTGKAIAGLTGADFAIVEGGVQRDITRVSPADDPMRIVLLVDNSESMHSSVEDVRKAVQVFVDGIGPQHEIGLITIGNTPVVRQTPSTDHAKIKDLAQKMSTSGGTMLIAAVMEMYDRFLRDVRGRWPMFIIITSDGAEASAAVDPRKFNAMLQDMQVKGLVAHAIVMSTMGRGVEVAVTQALTQATGGHYDSISASSALPQKLTELAAAITAEFDRVAAEYVLEYASPSTDTNAQLGVAVKRSGANVTLSRGVRVR